jgi:hypothetical protein
MPRWLETSLMSVLGGFGSNPVLRQYLILKNKTQFWRRTTGRKSSMCKGKPHAKNESMQGTQEGKPNHFRVRVLVRYCNRW